MKQAKKLSNIGLSISPQVIEVAVFSPKNNAIVDAASLDTPAGLLDVNGDRVLEPQLLKEAFSLLFKQLKTKVDSVNLTIPGTLFRMVDLPKMTPDQLYVSLSSEAERYRTFDNTDAVVDFEIIENPAAPAPQNKVNLIFGAVRQDALEFYLAALKALKVKVASVSVEPIDILRGMAGTGVLDSLVEQIGTNDFWGTIFVEPERVRISLWQGSTLFEFRETNFNTSDFATAAVDSLSVADIVEEIRRTTKAASPRIWLTYNMPPNMQSILSDLFSLPVRDCNLGSALALSNPNLHLSTLGAALQPVVTFPFPINLANGLLQAGGGKAPASPAVAEMSGGSDDNSGVLIGLGATAVILSVLVSAGLFFGNLFLQGQLTANQSQLTQKQASVTALTAEKTELTAKVSVYQKLKTVLDEARIRNRIYVMLTEDLQQKKPKRLWVQDIHVGGGDNDQYRGKITFEGKAHDHQDILFYARRFDQVPYLKAFTIDEIREERLMGTPMFNYKIEGELELNPSVLSNTPPVSPDAAEIQTP